VSKVEGLFLGHATNVGLYYIKICSVLYTFEASSVWYTL
jgi:hypothetical protein